jgi:hypothetical protein
MSFCIVHNNLEYKTLKEEIGKSSFALDIMITDWFEKGGKDLNRLPTAKELMPSKELIPDKTIKNSIIQYDSDDAKYGSKNYANSIMGGMETLFFEYFHTNFPDSAQSMMLKGSVADLSKAFNYVYLKLNESNNSHVKYALNKWPESKRLFSKYLEGKKIKISDEALDYTDMYDEDDMTEDERTKLGELKSINISAKKSASSLTRLLIASLPSYTKDKEGRLISNLSVFTDISFLKTKTNLVEWEVFADNMDVSKFKHNIYKAFADFFIAIKNCFFLD